MVQKIFISGMHSGQNPSPGVGIARSIRATLSTVENRPLLVGVDHWQGSTGLHDKSIDEVMILPQWHQMDNKRHAQHIRSLLDEGHLWVSSLDMEVRWFADHFGTHERLLAPSKEALRKTEKPAVEAFCPLGFNVPEYISATLPDTEIHSFLRHSAWQCWLKTPFHDAARITSWSTFERARANMSAAWRTDGLFLQKNVAGNEESICFAAYQGELLAAIHMQKRLLAPHGKTWAGRVSPLTDEHFREFQAIIRDLHYTGGGEIEYVIDPDGRKWIIELNPRFPAWIYGAALVGANLPGRLIAKALHLPFLEELSNFPFFTRVVQEIPVRESVGLPLPADPSAFAWVAEGGKGKGSGAAHALSIPTLHDSIDEELFADDDGDDSEQQEEVPVPLLNEVRSVVETYRGETPERVHLEDWTNSRFKLLAEKVAATRSNQPEIRIGYSSKTSPTPMHLSKARRCGFLAECISQLEVHRALECGFRPDEVILNGPGKFWPATSTPVTGLHLLFCDSIEEFDRVLEIPEIASAIGFRMRLPDLHSRFGNPLQDFDVFERIVDRVGKLRRRVDLGFHFHMASWAIGMGTWLEALRSLVLWCQSIEHLTSVPVKRLDLGGGYFPQDLENLDFEQIQRIVRKELPAVEGLYFEPGRSLTQDGEILVSRVLDVRRKKDGSVSDIVVDACIAELPLISAYAHRVYFNGTVLREGKTRILGRICMEDDILSPGVGLPETIEIGDLVTFGNAGAYERTMSYGFGRG